LEDENSTLQDLDDLAVEDHIKVDVVCDQLRRSGGFCRD